MQIQKIKTSRIDTIDFNNLLFGRVFSDHMLLCKYKNGSWEEPEIKPYAPVLMPLGTQALHYGQSVFEGMKCFKNDDNEVLFFRKEDNFKRLNKSSVRLSIPEIPAAIFFRGLNALISLDSEWCLNKEGYSLYIRPFIFASSECIKASASEEYTFCIITSPSTIYYNDEINVIIEQKYSRASKGGVGFAKAAGNYALSFFPTKIANKQGFTQIIWTDAKEHKYIEEAGTMNIWFRINNKLITPELSDSILAGITRDSIIQIARDRNIEVEERRVSVEEIVKAHKDGTLKEAFGTGTAVTVSPIKSITYNEQTIELSNPKDSFATMLKQDFQGIQKARKEDIYNWTSRLAKAI